MIAMVTSTLFERTEDLALKYQESEAQRIEFESNKNVLEQTISSLQADYEMKKNQCDTQDMIKKEMDKEITTANQRRQKAEKKLDTVEKRVAELEEQLQKKEQLFSNLDFDLTKSKRELEEKVSNYQLTIDQLNTDLDKLTKSLDDREKQVSIQKKKEKDLLKSMHKAEGELEVV